MIIRDFTAEDYAAVVGVHASQKITWPEWPVDPQAWADADARRPPKYLCRRWVAVEDGQVVGYAGYKQSAGEYHPQRFQVDVKVLPGYQRRGIGSALYACLLDGLQRFDPRVLRADAFTHLPHGFRFLQSRGFFEAFRETPVYLDAHAFDPTPYAQLETGLNAQGIFIKTLRELEVDPDRNQKLFEMYCAADADIPHEEIEIEPLEFSEWLSWGVSEPYVLPDAYLVAICAGEYVALRDVSEYGGQALLGGLMGVRRDFRQRGIALALMVRNLIYAREHGYREFKDCTAVQNAPMQALFNRLGFSRAPEWQQCQKNLG
ncbi:MAG TPA: GNAT family N-acetyltransferase [Anaerolineaceae bacterium]